MRLPNIELNELRYFHCVATAGSFAEGARRAHVSPPAVSKAIKRLEETLDTTLFDRSGRKVALTPTGEVLLAHATRVLEAMQQLGSAVDDAQGVVRGTLSVGCTEEFAAHALPLALVRIAQRHPDLKVRTYLMGPVEMARHLLDGALDVGLVPGRDGISDDLEVIELMPSPVSVVCGRGHPLFEAGKVAMAETEVHPFVVPEFFAQSGARDPYPAEAPPRTVGATVELVNMAIQMVVEGGFLGCFPDVMIRCQLNHEEVRAVDGFGSLPDTELAAICRAGTQPLPSVQQLLDELRQALQETLTAPCPTPI